MEEGDDNPPTWYIPHHAVTRDGKVRVVFDCSFQHRGTALNDHLLTGPDLGASLFGVLLRYRQHEIAVSADIKAMFHQVHICEEDGRLLQFLCRGMNRTTKPDIYKWNVVIFGATCSLGCASYAVQRHVIDEWGDSAKATLLLDSLYVDNYLASFPSEEEAATAAQQTRDLLLDGGFNLVKWASSCPGALRDIPGEAKTGDYERLMSLGETLNEPTLGLLLDCKNDTLVFNQRLGGMAVPTRRTVVSESASQFDPLGILTPFTARAKLIIQDLWRDKSRGWDDPLSDDPNDLLSRWTTWRSELTALPKISIPRCYMPRLSSDRHYELHVFNDAAHRLYGAVAYLRGIAENEVDVGFVAAKSRVAPLKQMSIPRLELCAARLGARLAATLKEELSLKIHSTTLWSDSLTVLEWIKSDSCRYKVFVGTRIAEIQELSEVTDWKYVNTSDNPADDLTRGKPLEALNSESRWLRGPDFLCRPSAEWPETPISSGQLSHDSEELRKSFQFCGLSLALPDFSVDRFATWSELVEEFGQEWFHRQNGTALAPLDAAQRETAERQLLRRAQMNDFPAEYAALSSGRPVAANSRLLQLAPLFDTEDGLIRVGGRCKNADDMAEDCKHPVILSRNNHVTTLLIKSFDEKLLHPGRECLLAELRRKFWILQGRAAVRKVQGSCMDCRRFRGKPQPPRMADLPPCRLRLFKPPFYSTGADCFGPIVVTIGRRNEKRWGIIFTCLTVRAIHLELLESLDTDAFLMAFRRFTPRRGTPRELWLDRGTNFVGGRNEIADALSKMDPQVAKQLADKGTAFKFITPSAPTHSGAWEREVKSAKAALYAGLKDHRVSEPVLHTLFVEVEGVLNSKPLTYVSTDAHDPDPITPQMLLTGRTDHSLPPATYPDDEMLTRRRWRQSQVLADRFWRRFIREYLPTIQSRRKWQQEVRALRVGDIVLIIDNQLIRAQWPMGTIVQVFPAWR